MASSKQSHCESLISASSQITDCAICMETMKTPKGLPCFHTFCLQCLQKYGADKLAGDELPCPMCRQPFIIPKEGMESLPSNFFIQQLLEGQTLKTEEPGGHMKCDMCSDEDKGDALKYCVECDQSMCEGCVLAHSRVRVARAHKVLSTVDRQEFESMMASRPHYCESHEDQSVKLYCNDCKQPICLICMAVNHNGHPCSELKKAAEKFTGQIRNCIPEITECMDDVHKEMTQQNEHKNDLLQQISKAEQLISERCKSLIEVIEKQRDELLDKLNNIKQERHKVMETRKDEILRQSLILISFKTYMEKLMKHGSAYEISRSAEELLARAKDLVKSQAGFKAGQLTRSHVAFNAVNEQVGARSGNIQLVGDVIVISDMESGTAAVREDKNNRSMKFTDLLGKAVIVHIIPKQSSVNISGIATIDSRLMVIRLLSQQIIIYNTSSFAETDHLTVAEMKNPSGLVACHQLNSLFISDASLACIHKVNLSDNITSRWSVKGDPYSISLTKACNLLVAISRPGQIIEFATDGHLIRQINLDKQFGDLWHCLELPYNQFAVSHIGRARHGVSVLDREGQVVRAYGRAPGSASGQLYSPRGLATDSTNQLLVADFGNDKIQLLSPSLTHLGDVTLPWRQLRQPRCLHFDELNGRLYIGEWSEGRVFVISTSDDG